MFVMKVKNLFLLITLAIFTANINYAQSKDIITLKTDSDFDIRKTAAKYFGNPDLWPYILRYNKIKSLDEIKPGATLLIPQKQVTTLLTSHNKAKEALQRAVVIGAKVLAIEKFSEAEESYSKALRYKESFEYDLSIQNAMEAIRLAEEAYKQTKEIRDKTIDAIVSYKKGILQKRFVNALSWQSAELYENLRENDMARTLALSFARITFNDLSQIKLNENSLAVIQRSRIDPLTNKTTSQVKLEKGDAYASLLNSPKKKFDLDIPGVKTEINSKYFWVEKNPDDTKLANYNGEIKLGVKDSAVVVKKNQGSVIPRGGMPSTPSELLPPPILKLPTDQSNYQNENIIFTWESVPNAESYWLQISFDSGFNNLYLLKKEIKATQIVVSITNAGTYYWRVCSVDKNGLPGNYSAPFGFVLFNKNNKPYLSLDNKSREVFTSDKTIKIKGSTLSICKVLVNEVKVTPDNEGKFEADIKLSEGKNVIIVKSVDPSGNESVVNQNIYFESNPNVELLFEENRKDFNAPNIITNKDNLAINLITRPFAQITVENKNNQTKRFYYADSLGKFVMQLTAKSNKTPFNINIVSKAGFKRSTDFILIRDLEAPKIFLNSIAPKTKSPKLKLTGKIEGAKSFLINGRNEQINSDNSFQSEVVLSEGINIIELIAIDEAGNINKQIESVTLDTQPPKLESANIIRDKKGTASIVVKAKDESELTNHANIEYMVGNTIINDILKFNKIKQVYELDIPDSPDIKIRSVELSDYLSNRKVYTIN